MASGLITEYLGSGVIASRPATPTLHTASLGLWYATDTGALSAWDGTTWTNVTSGAGAGDVVGPASAVDDHIVTFDTTTGKLIQDGGQTIAQVIAANSVIAVASPSNASGTVTLDFGSRSRYVGKITLAANVTTLAVSNLPAAGNYAEYELHIAQDATGGRTFAIPASHKALGGSDTAIASAANAVTVLTASTTDDGTNWRYAMQESA